MSPRSIRLLASLAALFASSSLVAEDFDEPGSPDWVVTILPDPIPSGDGTFARDALTTALGAPATTPALPINAGDDKEGRYFEQSLAISTSYALMAPLMPANDVADASMEGFVAIGNPDPFGSQSVGFILRADPTPNMNAYTASLDTGSQSGIATLRLARIRNGIIEALTTSMQFPVDLDSENYRLRFTVAGDDLLACIWRVRAVSGNIVETPIDLDPAAGIQNTLFASDDELTAGRAGVRAFCRGDNSIFWDDLRVRVRDCDKIVDFESQTIGTIYGSSLGHAPGDLAFVEDGIPVFLDTCSIPDGGSAFDDCFTLYATIHGFDHVVLLNSINLRFEFGPAPICPDMVQFEYYPHPGEFENIQVNDAPVFVGALDLAPTNIAPGVTLSIAQLGQSRIATLTGRVHRLTIGGQDLLLDNICVATNCPDDIDGNCDVDVTDLLAVLGNWGPCPSCDADVNGDDVVDISDLLAVLGAW